MLLLTRRVGEEIKVGEDMFVRVLRVRGGQVTIGIDAPKEINIVRTELLVREEDKVAACEHTWVIAKLKDKPNRSTYCGNCNITFREYCNKINKEKLI